MRLYRYYFLYMALLIAILSFQSSAFGQPGIDSALIFSGNTSTGTSVEATDTGLPSGVQSRTIEAWIKASTSQPSEAYITSYGTLQPTQSLLIGLISGRLVTTQNGDALFGSQFINDDTWHHIAVVYDGTTGTYTQYIDGVVDGSKVMVTNTVLSGTMRFGKSINPQGKHFNGTIDEIRYWNIARTQAQIQADKDAELPGPQPGLVGYWKMNEGAGQSVQDLAGTNHGTLGTTAGIDINDPVWTFPGFPKVAANQPPEAFDSSESTMEETPVGGTMNAGDPNNDQLTYVLAGPASQGAVLLTPLTNEFIYTPNPDAHGSDSFQFRVFDTSFALSNIATVTITIGPVNDPPSFTKGSDPSVPEDAGAQSVANWATNITVGPANESGQTATFNTSNNNNALFSAQPSVSPDGTLTYTPAPDANGSATVTVELMDDGGTANGGVDTSAPQTFNIPVGPVNDAPSFTVGPNQAVPASAGTQSVSGWATGISPGPANESGQTVMFNATNDNNSLFSSQPSISSDGTLSYTPAVGPGGDATVTVTLADDGGTANGGVDTSAPQTFTVSITTEPASEDLPQTVILATYKAWIKKNADIKSGNVIVNGYGMDDEVDEMDDEFYDHDPDDNHWGVLRLP